MENSFQNHSFKIKQLSNKELLFQTKFLVQKERDIHIQVLHHLAEIDSRKLYFKQGFSSLFNYVVRELGYSEGAAYRRIKAMKLCRDLPGTESRLQSGRLSLSVASQLQVFFEKQIKKAKEKEKKTLSLKSVDHRISESEMQKQESKWKPAGEVLKKEGQNSQSYLQVFDKKVSQNEELVGNPEPHRFLSWQQKENLVKRAEGRSTRATAKLLSETDPSLSLSKEQARFLGKGKVEIKVVIDESCHKKLEELKNLLSHKNPNLSYGELISILSEEALKKHDPRRKNTRRRKEKKVQKKLSVKKQEFKGKVADPAVTFALRSKQKDKTSEQSEVLSGRSAASAKKSIVSASQKQHKKMISRYIPSYLRKYIWERDGGQCVYVHHETKRRCTSRHLLQIDHIQPFALGGKTEKENLRLLCAGHNQYRS